MNFSCIIVEYNIRYGSAQATEAQVQEAVQQSNLVDTLTKLPQVWIKKIVLCICD